MKKIIRSIIWGIIGFLARIRVVDPVGIAKLKYLEMLHKWPDFKRPRDLNEKINWLKFNSDTSLWVRLADKYAVREYVAGKGLGDHLVKLYGKWDEAAGIDWDSLPSRFIMKTNNGSGDVVICKDKSLLDIPSVSKRLSGLLEKDYGALTGEPHYGLIKPCIIAEELLDISTQPCGSSSLVDYKVWCFDGKPYYIWACYDRTPASVKVNIYDLDWNVHPEYTVVTSHYRDGHGLVPKPGCLQEILRIASILSEGFPEVRIDLYEVDGKVYFGEMTFTSVGGFMNCYSQEFLNLLGDLTVLPE